MLLIVPTCAFLTGGKMTVSTPFFVFLLSYIIGSFPSAYLIGRLNHINIFEIGSGNMGANNVGRSLGAKWGVAVWGIDSFKGMLAVILARLIMPRDEISASVISAIAVVTGHNWSLLATLITGKLRGGKGVSTAAGTLLMMAPAQIVVITISLWAAIVLLTRYMSLGALVAVAVASIWMLILISQQEGNIPQPYALYAISVAAMVYVRHWKNILLLLAGRERRIGERATP